jgi:AcrR family transcriptional regulator
MTATREALTSGAIDVVPPEALYAKLRPGPGRSAGEVALHQRARIYGAMADIVSERGYDAVTVRELARLAGVSTRTFYEHFESKEECLLRTFDQVVQRARGHVIAAQEGDRDWEERLRLGFAAFAREVEQKPRMGRLAFVETLAAGPPALERMRVAEQTFGAMIEDGFAQAPDGIEMPPLVVEGIVAGVASVVRGRLLNGQERELPDLAGELVEWALCYRGDEAASVGQLGLRPAYATGALATAARPDPNEEELGDERALIVLAAAKLAAADGYRQLTIPRIRAAAGVSRKSFDNSFKSIDECFVAALELHAACALSYASTAYEEAPSWASGVHRGVVALCEYIARDPVLAALGFVEIFALGPEGMRVCERLTARATELFRGSAQSDQRPNPLVAEASVGAVWGLMHHHVASGHIQQLMHVAPTLSFMAMAPAIGAPAALGAISESATPGTETSTTHQQSAGELLKGPLAMRTKSI